MTMKSLTFTGPAFCALWPVAALRTTVIKETRFFRPKTRSPVSSACPSSRSPICRKSAPSAAISGCVPSSSARVRVRHVSGAQSSSYSAKARPVL
jgi:hypothetical protein